MSGGGSKKGSKVKKGEGLWLYSFCDMCLILMSFFALQLSFSKPNVEKFDTVNTTMMAKKKKDKKEDNLQTMSKELIKEIKKSHLDNTTQVTLDSEGLAIEFKDKLLFSSGSADSDPNFAKVTEQVMELIAKSNARYKISIEGHTDDTPMGSHGKYKTNWDLSAARGVTLLNQFKERGVASDRMRVIAYAETKPKVPIEGKVGADLEAARAANRRVVIRLE